MVAVLLDVEGTLHSCGVALPGAAATVSWLRERRVPLRFLTNVDSRPAAALADELSTVLGVAVTAGEVFTPLAAAHAVLAGQSPYLLVAPAVRAEFGQPPGRPPYSHVVVGDCRDVLDYRTLDEAFRAIRAGAQLVALQRGRYFRRDDGDHLDTGAVVAALEYAAGVRARVLGKPSVDFFQLAAASVATALADCVVVGDDAGTDILGGRKAGARTVQVRTGKYADQLAEGSLEPADAVLGSVAELPGLLTALL